MSEKVEWKIGYKDEQGKLVFLTAGAQTLFGKTTAEKLVKKLGPPWELLKNG